MDLTWDDVQHKINNNKSTLLDILVLDVHLEAKLCEVGVITRGLEDDLKPVSLSPMKRVDMLLNDLKAGHLRRFLRFCQVMMEEGRSDILEALDVDMDVVTNQLEKEDDGPPKKKQKMESKTKPATKRHKCHYYKRIESEELIPIPSDFIPSLLQHCGSYKRTLMKTSLFGYKKSIPIDLTKIYICQNPSCKMNQSEKIPVSKEELFLKLFENRCPNCLSMEGPAGTGKSSFMEKYAYDWSEDLTSCEERGPDVPCEGHSWKLVVYIAAGGIRGSAEDAIKANLRCKPYPPDQMMSAIVEDGDGILLLYDAMDELRNKESIESISSYIQMSQNTPGAPRVLVSARDGLLSVERMFFDRELHLEGFSLPQGIDYVRQYFKVMHSISDHPVLPYVEAHSEDLEWVLSNPLRVHILSELTARGFLTLQDVKTLTTVKLFRSLDQLLLTRDRENRPSPSRPPPKFYQACLRCLLTDTRSLDDKDVGSDSPYLSMLQKHDYMDDDFNDIYNFSFPHEMLFEYFSMRGLIECLMNNVDYVQAMLLWLCSNEKMRNVLQLTCGYIAQFTPKLFPFVVFIIRASLILQSEAVQCERNELTAELLKLPAIIQETFTSNILTQHLSPEAATKLGEISNRIEAVHNEKAGQLRMAAWFLNVYSSNDRISAVNFFSPFQEFLLGCLQQLTSQQQQEVFTQTINPLLPCTHKRSLTDYLTIVPVAGVRWAAVEESWGTGFSPSLDVTIHLWSPCDLSLMLNTWSHLPRVQQQLQQQRHVKYQVFIDKSAYTRCTSLPPDPWSEEQWVPGITELLSPSYSTGEILVVMGTSTPPLPITGLLSACKKVITPGHGLTGGVGISSGQVLEEELTGFCTFAREVGLKLELWQLKVVLKAGCGEEDWKNVESAIRKMVEVEVSGEKGVFSRPTYLLNR